MPFWAIVYCLLIMLSGIGVVIIYKKRPIYYIPGQVLSSLLWCVNVFCFYYDSFVHKPQSFLVIFGNVFFLYFLYWELWENRHLFPTLVAEKEKSSEEELVFFLKSHSR